MSFSIRHNRRFPICCPVTYYAGLHEGHGIARNPSVSGWRFSDNVPLRVGQTCPLTINLPDEHPLFLVAVTVRWVRGIWCGNRGG